MHLKSRKSKIKIKMIKAYKKINLPKDSKVKVAKIK
jgi:hypothetical protein